MGVKHIGWCLLGAVILMVGLVVLGVSFSPWVYVIVGLTCPLMVLFMAAGMQGSGAGRGAQRDNSRSAV